MDVAKDPQTSPGPSPRSGLRTFSARRTLLTTAVAAVLIAGALVIRPAEPDAPQSPKPEERALSAVGAGSPAAVQDLTALIGDREAWLRTHPEDSGSWAVLGSAYLERARRTADSANYPPAERALQRSLAAKPLEKGNIEAVVGMGALANARHDFGTAKRWGELVRAQSPGRWAAYPVLIDAYSGLGEYPAAGKAMEKLVALRPGTLAYTSVAQVYRDRGWREDAAAAMQQAAGAAGSPTEKADSMYRLGELSWERGEPEEALRHFESALRTDPTRHQALGGRARTLAALDRSGEAVKDYRTALKRAPVPQYALELGELLESLGRAEEAREPYDLLRAQIARSATHGVSEELTLGLFEADHGDPAAAARRLSAEWKRHKSMHVADALGWALYQQGKHERALVFAKKATNAGLRSADFAYHRGLIERALGLHGAARRHLDEALRTNPRFSPLRAPLALEALDHVGEPPPGGPENMQGTQSPAPGTALQPAEPQTATGQQPQQQPQQQQQQQPSPQPRPQQPQQAQPQQAQPQQPRPQQAQPPSQGAGQSSPSSTAPIRPAAPPPAQQQPSAGQ
ncbi:tetratricopeptide repeat protein [Streptomyces sp. A3M-1-3]|uniref:tetratricopeptide repeat protein n=1 Tax=Streptomyces sp. A3M-1-3 TaxID=2962044 RepID=UPI0020B87966|nr:tetratricopeptide repeat protein [Streptomyces sp. A3M-1-3]MCP3822499.1 tetratricopeptide repeat protein [Streptomyces sp. A3M-1-3]